MNAIDPAIHIAAANIRLQEVTKSYGAVTIIPKLDVEFREGEFTVVLGPSGCGKSTLMQMIAGLERVSGGKIFIGDREVQDLEPRERGCAMALPTVSLALFLMAYITRVTRSAMLEVLNQDFVRTARAKGAPASVVIWRHALGNCLIQITTVVGLYLGILIGNSVLTEIVFNRPGLGKLILNALSQRDYTLLQGLIVVYTLLVVLVNLITDLTYGFLDPRVQYR